jgi:AhpD family alkylhydroperoxidase
MSTVSLIDYEQATPAVRAVYDDIKAARGVADVNNFWKALAHQPDTLAQTWAAVRDTMQPGALDALTKELIYLAFSIANGCAYCIHSHTAAAHAKGLTPEQQREFLAVIALASQTNTLATALQVPVDRGFDKAPRA